MMWKVGRVLFQPKLVFAVFWRLDGHREVHSNPSGATAASDKILQQSRSSQESPPGKELGDNLSTSKSLQGL